MKINFFPKSEIEITEQDVKATFKTLVEIKRRLIVPKNKRGKIGIVVALKTEKDKEKTRLENDLIQEIHKYLQSSKIADKFQVIQFPQKISEKIIDDKKAFEYLVRARGHFLIYGSLVQRNFDEKISYVFKLQGLVRHLPVTLYISNKLSREFAELLPQKIVFPEAKEVLGFEITQRWIGYVIKYIIGIAAFISSDIDLSFKLFNELEDELKNINESNDVPPVVEIKNRLPLRLIETLELFLDRNYFFFIRTRDREYVLKTKPFLDLLQRIAPDDYKAHQVRAIYYFFQDKIDEAIHEFDDIKDQDIGWHYSLGFLLAYKGNIDKALEHYRKTFYKETGPNVVNDVDVFISEIIKNRPDLIQLYFFRGLINYKAKPDYQLAKEDFEYFLNQKESTRFPQLIKLSEKYLLDIKRHIGV